MKINKINLSEDMVDMIFREYLEQNGFKTAYYSPPCGSWSIITFQLNSQLYRTFSPRDVRRPDLILYSQQEEVLEIFVAESKGNILSFNNTILKQYVTDMRSYISKVLKGNFRHRKSNSSWGKWNKKIENLDKLKVNIHICFLAGSKYDYSVWESNKSRFKNLLDDLNDKTLFGVLVGVDWEKIVAYLEPLNNNLLKELLPNEEIISFSYP